MFPDWSSPAASVSALCVFAPPAAAFGFLPIAPPAQRSTAGGSLRRSFGAPSTEGVVIGEVEEEGRRPRHRPDGVHVYDNVFSPAACDVLRAFAIEGNELRDSEDTCLFVRPPGNVTSLTALELALDGALAALEGESSRGGGTVEYWTRDEHVNLDVHADIDEVELDEDGTLRAPSAAHVLYLRVRADRRGEAPTCVFPAKRMGWSDVSVESKAEAADGGGNSLEGVDLAVVPAVRGRVLRFTGSAMHAVPRPADRWLLSEEAEAALRREEAPPGEAEEEHGGDSFNFDDGFDEGDGDWEDGFDDGGDDDGDWDDDEDVERAVLLFNLWPDDGPPPRGVGGEATSEWRQGYGVNAAMLQCNPKSQWRERSFIINGGGDQQQGSTRDLKTTVDETTQRDAVLAAGEKHARVTLMGGRERRLFPEKVARLRVADEASLRNALSQEEEPTWLRLEQET